VRKLARKSCLPLLVDDTTVVQGSSEITTYLDMKFPNSPLTPPEPQAAREAIDWETYLDEHIGVSLRVWFYYYTLPDRELALKFLLQGASWPRSALFKVIFPKVREAMVEYMNINAQSAKQAEEQLLEALERLDGALSGRRFLVDDSFFQSGLDRLRTAVALVPSARRPGDTQATARGT